MKRPLHLYIPQSQISVNTEFEDSAENGWLCIDKRYGEKDSKNKCLIFGDIFRKKVIIRFVAQDNIINN